MNIKKFIISALSIIIFVFYSVFLFTVGISTGKFHDESVSAKNERIVSETEKLSLIIRETNGKIYVYEENSSTPQKKLDIDYNSLREYDKEKFKEGIKISSLEELTRLEEDFSN